MSNWYEYVVNSILIVLVITSFSGGTLYLISAIQGNNIGLSGSKYHDECISSHIETFEQYNTTTFYAGNTYEVHFTPFKISRTVCDKYALVRNATSDGK